MALSREVLFEGDAVLVRHVACRPEHADVGDVERAEADTVILPTRGAFVKHLSRTVRVLAEPTQVLFFAAGRPYRVSHPLADGDHCLVLQFSPPVLRDTLVATAGLDRLDDGEVRPGATLPPEGLATRAVLHRRLARGVATCLEVEECGVALLATAIGAARVAGPTRAPRAGTRARRKELTHRVREILLAAPARDARLGELARLTHTSPYHLARVFREEMGLPIHQYHLRVRLAGAVDRLLDTRRSVSRIALDVGFSTHSHFTAAFRQMIGMTPSELRRCASTGLVQGVRTILTGPSPSGG